MKVKIGDLFESDCGTIVNTINCVGAMGKGIALEFKKRYPHMYREYVEKCTAGEIKPGTPYFYKNSNGQNILNFPTKNHWRSPSRLSYILDGLDWFVAHYREYGIDSIAFPPLGCGNGGLTWEVVGPVMYEKLKDLPIQIEIYAPFGVSEKMLSESFLASGARTDDMRGHANSPINPKWYLILETVRELNKRQYALKVGRTIFQKICFVLTRNGVDTGFVFSRGSYGPFSPQVKDSIAVLANANLVIEKKLGRMLSLNVKDDVIIKQEQFTAKEWNAVEKTVDLFSRVKSTDQAEMVATVLYAYDQLAAKQSSVLDKDVYDYVLEWKPHWKEEKEFELCDAIHNMAMLSLMDVVYSQQLMETEVF